MIKWLALKGTDCFALHWPGSEHQGRTFIGMLAEDTEHPALILGTQVKKAVPGNQPIETAAEGQFAHIGNHPELFRKAAAAKFDQRQRCIDAREVITVGDEIAGNRLTRTAAYIENGAAIGQ